ncbi:MAG: phosphate ABC transporter permease PstA [Chromatiales bacterium]|nr:MAG: phosphate ABC transporter permease PstA [Chromatiales bacterium]
MAATGPSSTETLERVRAGLAARYRRERRFRLFGAASAILGLLFVLMLFVSIFSNGYSAFWQTQVKLDIYFDPEVIDPGATGEPQVIGKANFDKVVRGALYDLFPDVSGRQERRDLKRLVSAGAGFELREQVLADPALVGQTRTLWLPADDEVDMLVKGYIDRDLPEASRRLKDRQIAWIDALAEKGLVERQFNAAFFTTGDSREPELAGIGGAIKGSFFMLVVTLILSFPLGVAAAVYLEEFAPKNRWVDLIEVNINNLAAVPSIVFGLLGLAVFINFFGLPRSAPVVGGLVLTLMTLPTVIIASRAAIKSVPPSVREAALGVGASAMQTVFHHVIPLAMPGMLTGAIIGMARALGESAPLLMIGMIAFIVEVPETPLDPATALPVQIYLWADSPERAFVERTSAAIIVLLAFLLVMNGLAIWMRKKFERRW